MSNVKELIRPVDPVIVDMLEQVLADVRAGKVHGVVVISNEPDGYREWNAGKWRAAEVLYIVEHWKHRVCFGGGG